MKIEPHLSITALEKKFGRLRRAKKLASKVEQMQTGGGPAQSSPEMIPVSFVGGRDQGEFKQASKNLTSILKKEAVFKSTPRPRIP